MASLIRPLTLRTCVGLYPRLQHKHPHIFPAQVPTDGIDLNIEYADTANEGGKSPNDFEKVIVAIHGTPGYYSHFEHLIQHYRGSNVRVIAPNLPDFRHTRSSGGLFWHTTDEKLAFVKDFLAHLNIKQIDCLVSHSIGVHVTTALFEHPEDVKINSMAIIAAQPTWDMNPAKHRFVKNIFRFRNDAWYQLLSLLRIHNSPVTPVKFKTIDEFLWLMTTTRDFHTPVDLLRRIYKLRHQTKIPIIIQYGSKEPLISKRSLARLFAEFGLAESDIIRLDLSGGYNASELIRPGGPRIQSYIIEGGGHFAYAKYGDITVQMIENLLYSK